MGASNLEPPGVAGENKIPWTNAGVTSWFNQGADGLVGRAGVGVLSGTGAPRDAKGLTCRTFCVSKLSN